MINYDYGPDVITTIDEYRTGPPSLLEESERNYQAAMRYYEQKQAKFLQYAAAKAEMESEQVMQTLEDLMRQLIENEWSQLAQTAQRMVNIDDSGKYIFKPVRDRQNLRVPRALFDKLRNGVNNKNFWSEMGFYYEEWLEERLGNLTNYKINEGFAELLKTFGMSGDIKSDSSIRAKNREIRADLAGGIGINVRTEINAQGKRSTIAYASGTNVPVELQVAFDIQDNRLQGEITDNETLKQYLDTNLFGFSLKRWDQDLYSTEKHITSASGLQRMVNSQFEQSGDRTWNAVYAYRTMINIVSRFLIDILGPINIALITGTNFIWTSELLSDTLFYMHLYSRTSAYVGFGQNRALQEIKPYIASSNVYIKRLIYGRMQALANSQLDYQRRYSGTNNDGTSYVGYGLTFTINNG